MIFFNALLFSIFLSMSDMVGDLAGPWEWFLSLSGFMMAVVVIGSVLGFYLVFRIIFKLIEALAGMFH